LSTLELSEAFLRRR